MPTEFEFTPDTSDDNRRIRRLSQTVLDALEALDDFVTAPDIMTKAYRTIHVCKEVQTLYKSDTNPDQVFTDVLINTLKEFPLGKRP